MPSNTHTHWSHYNCEDMHRIDIMHFLTPHTKINHHNFNLKPVLTIKQKNCLHSDSITLKFAHTTIERHVYTHKYNDLIAMFALTG